MKVEAGPASSTSSHRHLVEISALCGDKGESGPSQSTRSVSTRQSDQGQAQRTLDLEQPARSEAPPPTDNLSAPSQAHTLLTRSLNDHSTSLSQFPVTWPRASLSASHASHREHSFTYHATPVLPFIEPLGTSTPPFSLQQRDFPLSQPLMPASSFTHQLASTFNPHHQGATSSEPMHPTGSHGKPKPQRKKVDRKSLASEARKWKCEYEGCGKAFPRKGGLADHTRVHTGERPFKCPVCNKAFGTKGNMNIHMKTHKKSRGPQSTSSTGAIPSLMAHASVDHVPTPTPTSLMPSGIVSRTHSLTFLAQQLVEAEANTSSNERLGQLWGTVTSSGDQGKILPFPYDTGDH